MNKITIIGLGLVGNSIGMGLKRAASSSQNPQQPTAIEVIGLDPERQQEADALRKYGSVDSIASSLEGAVEGADLIVIATPASAAREVMAAIAPYLAEGTVVTDVLPAKEQVMRWASETLGREISFVGGHPIISNDNPDSPSNTGTPNADLFKGARWAIIPGRGAKDSALNAVIWLAETLGASPLFIDDFEHDSFLAAVHQLPVVASAALWKVAHTSPAWGDMAPFAQSGFKSLTEPLSVPPEIIAGALVSNRQMLIGWLDRYLIALQDMRDMLAQQGAEGESGSADELRITNALTEAHHARRAWITESETTPDQKDARLRAELRDELNEARPSRSFMGGYLSDRIFRKKDRQ